MSKTKFKIIPPKSLDYIRDGTSKPVAQMKVDEIPPVAISWGRTTVFKTGSWRNVTPRYVRQMPPCRAGCPVGNDVEGWLEAAANENWDEAVDLLLGEQPLPSVCGRVCYHPCETACNRGQFDSPVSIRSVERFLGDKAGKMNMLPEKIARSNAPDGRILIVGSGPSGLAAAWLLTRLRYRVEIWDRAELSGGLLRYGIPDYRLPKKILDLELARLGKLGIVFRNRKSFSLDENLTETRRDFDAVYLAPGAAGHRSSGIRGSSGVVIGAIDFLAKAIVGKAPHIGRKVAVIGGGNSALDAARTALRLGAQVTILYRRTRSEMPAYEEEIEAALAEGVKIKYLVSPKAINKRDKTYLRCIQNRLGMPDDSGRRRPEPVPGSDFEILLDTVIDAVGEFPDADEFTRDRDVLSLIEMIDEWGRTGLENIWAGGDFAGNERTVAQAIGAGKRAAIDIDLKLRLNKRLRPKKWSFGANKSVSAQSYISGMDRLDYVNITPVEYEELNPVYFSRAGRLRQREVPHKDRKRGFAEVMYGFTGRSAQKESSRCFHCGSCDSCGNCHVFCPDGAVLRDGENGALSFDLDYCKGCGICASECPLAAIEMYK
ncbi:FAD-dependent oxidoreductase [bacterium]|nr:FAD-dependent oxidoreductase [bacterium]